MLSTLRLSNFKCFRDITIPFRSENILIGRNNAGKSTIVEAIRAVALVRSRYEHLQFRDPPYWTELNPKARGVAPSLDDLDIDFKALFHRYGEPPATIVATFENGAQIHVVLGVDGEEGLIHGVFRDKRGKPAQTASEARLLSIPSIAVLPQVAPLNKKEVVLKQAYVQTHMPTALSSQHFRNQIKYLYHHYTDFRKFAEDSWPGLRIIEFKGRNGESGDPLALLVQSEDFVAEASWMGHGLQMWLQTMWFLARSKSVDIVMLDEPDVYMHPDLQRRLIRLLKDRFPQTIVTTHSVEILSEVSPNAILLVDKRRQHAEFADSVASLQVAVDRLGATQNLQLSRLWTAKKFLLVEGKDVSILRYFHSLIFPDSLEPFGSIPNLSIGGWQGWRYALGSAMFLENAVGEEIRTYCILDSDYHIEEEKLKRYADADQKRVQLHIWRRKELESYLLVPSLIQRVIRNGNKKFPTEEEVDAQITKIGGSFRDQVQDAFAETFLGLHRSKGATFANQEARKLVAEAWDREGGHVERLPAKSVLSALSDWSKAVYGVSFGIATLLQSLRLSEIDPEVVEVLSAIHENTDFQRGSESAVTGRTGESTIELT